MDVTAPSGAIPRPAVRKRHRSPFFLWATAFMVPLVFAGFWPYYGPLLSQGAVPERFNHWGIHLHSTLNLGWLTIFAFQAALVWRGRTTLHKRLGKPFFIYGLLLIAVGLVATTAVTVWKLGTGSPINRQAAMMFTLITDLVMFGGFLIAGYHWRRRAEAHKRLMLLATWSLAVVGAFRFIFRALAPIVPLWAVGFAFMTPLALLALYDWIRLKRIHPVTWIGIGVFGLRLARPLFSESELWQPTGRWLLSLLT